MSIWKHGGNIYEVSRLIGCNPEEIIDLSASINPLGPPEGLREILFDRFHKIRHYPDIHNRSIIEAISAFHNIPADYIAVGNGSTEILYWLPYALNLERVAIVVPTFNEYIRALQNKGAIIRFLATSWENGFQPTLYQLEALIEAGRPDAIFLTNPGSPSGISLAQEVREFIKSITDKIDLLWIVDEVFADFCEEYSLATLVNSSEKIIIIRSLTKFYALPGLRLGYLLAHPRIVKKVRSFIPPWSVNTLAQEAGSYCLSQQKFRKKTLEFFNTERARLFDLLESIPEIDFLRSMANYILIRLGESIRKDAHDIQMELLKGYKILVRNCENFRGLSNRFIRVAISSSEINDLWIASFRDILRE